MCVCVCVCVFVCMGGRGLVVVTAWRAGCNPSPLGGSAMPGGGVLKGRGPGLLEGSIPAHTRKQLLDPQ